MYNFAQRMVCVDHHNDAEIFIKFCNKNAESDGSHFVKKYFLRYCEAFKENFKSVTGWDENECVIVIFLCGIKDCDDWILRFSL